jgi:hypothetical protein
MEFQMMFWIGLTVFVLVVAVPWFWGLADLYIAYRFRKETEGKSDQTSFLLNWFAWKWSWVNRSGIIVEKMPFFQKDLTEIFGIKEDDGKVT